MGKGDRRKSNKMLQRRSRAKYKARMERGPGLARAPSADKPAAPVEEEPAAEATEEQA